MEIIGKHHKEWVSIVQSFGGGMYSEDIVQESYIRIHNSQSLDNAIVDGKVNKAFMYVTLRNNFVNYARQKAKVRKVQIIENYLPKSEINANTRRHIANDILDDKIKQEMDKWHWYDREVFKLITSKKVSMRKLSRDSRISLSSIANTMNKCKRKLKEIIGEDYEDYINKEYEFIK